MSLASSTPSLAYRKSSLWRHFSETSAASDGDNETATAADADGDAANDDDDEYDIVSTEGSVSVDIDACIVSELLTGTLLFA